MIGIQAVLPKRNKHLKPDRDTNLNDPRSEVDCSDCNLRLVWSSMEQKIEFSIAKSRFRLAKRNATKKKPNFSPNLGFHKVFENPLKQKISHLIVL